MKILITGNKSGLGKYLYENTGGVGLNRNTSREKREQIKREGVDIIIHCAFSSNKEITSETLYPYFNDNVLLTKELISCQHKKFIFFSSVDIYPKNKIIHSEDEIIDINTIDGIYPVTKLISESIVKKYCQNYLILRGTAFLGKYSRENTLIKIIKNRNCILTVTGDSEFNYILHSDIADFLNFAIKKDLKGTYNLASSENITVRQIVKILARQVKFGKYHYCVGKINNNKIASIFPIFRKTSREVINQFIRQQK